MWCALYIIIFIYFFSPVRSYRILSQGLHFNGQGTRLLCLEDGRSFLSLYDLNSEGKNPAMWLTAPGYSTSSLIDYSDMGFCFAGRDGEFVAGCCEETDRVYIWSTDPSRNHQHNGKVKPLFTLKHYGCNKVRYNEFSCTLVSFGNILKVWTPFRLPESISRSNGDVTDTSIDQENSETSSSSDESGVDENMGVSDNYVLSNSGKWQVE